MLCWLQTPRLIATARGPAMLCWLQTPCLIATACGPATLYWLQTPCLIATACGPSYAKLACLLEFSGLHLCCSNDSSLVAWEAPSAEAPLTLVLGHCYANVCLHHVAS